MHWRQQHNKISHGEGVELIPRLVVMVIEEWKKYSRAGREGPAENLLRISAHYDLFLFHNRCLGNIATNGWKIRGQVVAEDAPREADLKGFTV